MRDHLPGIHGHVEVSWRTAPPSPMMVQRALKVACPGSGCVPNVFLDESDEDGIFVIKIAHDDECSWLNASEAGGGNG